MVEDLKTMEPVIKQLKTDVPLIFEKIDAMRQQASEYQLETMSTRIEAADDAPAAASTPPEPSTRTSVNVEERNWHALREVWKRNTQRLEFIIDQIPDGRKRVAYDRLPRTNWDRIVDRLQSQELISFAAANASKSLNELFNMYRPRNRKIPDEVAGSLQVLDQQLDKILVPYRKVVAFDEAANAPPPPLPTMSFNNGRLSANIPGQSQG
jgi:hypothetical protein